MHKKWMTIAVMMVVLVLLVGVVPASAAPHASGIVHIVQYGETLYSISRRYGVDVWTIANANGIANPSQIYAGQRIVIPGGRPAGIIHVVQAGETMLHIALRYGVDAWTIARANGISNLNYIYVGQRLTIPQAAPPAPKPKPQPSLPTSWPGPWSGEYFDNATLAGDAYMTRTDESINFDWDWGPPAGGMPTNAFSVRWTGTFSFDAGTYRFYTKVDDGVRIYVDDGLLIDSWRDGGFRSYTKDLAVTAGDHTVRVEYYDRTQVARIYFWWKVVSSTAATATPGPTATPKPGESGTTSAPTDGWFAEFYNNESLTGDPVATRHDAWIGFDWGTDSPMTDVWRDGFSVRWTAKTRLDTDHYRFCAMSDDGVRIWVGKDLIIDAWHASNGSELVCQAYWAATGTYEVKVEYYENGGNALIYVWWEPH